jgi:C4-dicarboxylate-specific signal transduction histidine kinase
LVLLWFLGFSGLIWANRGLQKRARERDIAKTELQKAHDELEKRVKERTADLKKALDDINTLKGIVPICSHCKKIRDDKGYWNQLEVYVQKHSDAEFSHGICPDCAKEHYPDLNIYDK